MRKIAVVLGGVVIVVAIISPYYAGKRIESKFEQKVAALNSKINKYFHVKDFIKLEYHAGWFYSTAKTSVGDNVIINHAITHGPYLFLGLGRVESRWVIPEKGQQEYQKIKALFNGQEPYNMTTEISYSGTTYFNFHSPAIGEKPLPDSDSGKIIWDGLDLTAKFSKSKVATSFEMPKFAIANNEKAFSVEGVKTSTNTDSWLDKQLNLTIPTSYNLNSKGGIDKITFSSLKSFPAFTFELNKLTSQANSNHNSFINNIALANITAALDDNSVSIANVTAENTAADILWILRKDLIKANWATKKIVDANDIKVINRSSDIKVAFNYHQEQEILDDDNKVGYREFYKVTALNAEIPNYDNFIKEVEFGFKLTGLPKKQTAGVLTNYVEYIKASFAMLYSDNRKTLNMQRGSLYSSLESFAVASLQETPSFETNMMLQGSQGIASADFNVSLIKTDTSTKDVQKLVNDALPRYSAKLVLEIPKAMLADFFSLANASKEKLEQFEQQIAEQYPAVIQDNAYKIVMELKNGQVYVNGEFNKELTKKFIFSYR